MKKQIDVTIVVVNFNTAQALRKCIESVYKFAGNFTFEIYVVDNGSGDNSSKMVGQEFPETKLIMNKKNEHVTTANNMILKKARGKYALILNSDIEFTDNAIFKLKIFLDKHTSIGGVTCRQILPDGKTDVVCSRFFTPVYELVAGCLLGKFLPFRNKVIAKFRYFDWDRRSSREVEAISDIILLVRMDLFRKIGFYDENIKLFFMEDDLSIRIKKAGYELWYLGNTSVRHLKGATTQQFTPARMYQIYESDMLYYYGKYSGWGWKNILRFAFLSNRIYYRLIR